MPEPMTLVGFAGGVLGLLVHLARRYFEIAKEVVDVLLGAIMLVVCLPLLGFCAVLIKLSSAGPVVFRQQRVGKDGKLFTVYKLRTMRPNAEGGTGAVWACSNDPRVLPACRWMRKTHVDELPQLVNVIRGDMSLVGPRPERPEILERLQEKFPEIRKRLAVRPGITGLAQVRLGYNTDVESYRRKLRADLEYIEKRCWLLELGVMMRTVTRLYDRAAN